MRLPNASHESILSGLTGQPDSVDVLNDAANEIQRNLEHFHWPKNVVVHGLIYHALWSVYCAGERRGAARENNPVTALFPIPVLEQKVNNG